MMEELSKVQSLEELLNTVTNISVNHVQQDRTGISSGISGYVDKSEGEGSGKIAVWQVPDQCVPKDSKIQNQGQGVSDEEGFRIAGPSGVIFVGKLARFWIWANHVPQSKPENDTKEG
jgi:hypothetical protein